MIAIGYRTLRTRAGAFLGAFILLTIVATIIAAAGQLMASALRDPGPGRFATADLVVRADPRVTLGRGEAQETITVRRSARLSAAVVDRLRATPGVEDAIGDLSVPVSVLGDDGTVRPTRGDRPAHVHGWSAAGLTPYRVMVGRAPTAADEVVLDAGLAPGMAVGDTVEIVAPSGTRTLRLTGIVEASDEQEDLQSALFVPDATAQNLSGLGSGFDAIALILAAGGESDVVRQRVEDLPIGAVQVLTRGQASTADVGRPQALSQEEVVAVIGVGGAMTLLVAILVVSGTMTFMTERRRREIALLRAVGATPGQIRRLLVMETAVVGLVAGGVGCIGGRLLALPFARGLVRIGVAPEGFLVQAHWVPDIVAPAAGAIVALLASLLAVRRGLRVRPGEALVAAAVPARRMGIVRIILGTIILGGGAALVIIFADSAIEYAVLSALCFALGVATLAPALLGVPAAFLGRLIGARGSGARFLAGAGLAAGRFRVGAVAGPIVLVVALAGAQIVSLATAGQAVRDVTAERTSADQVLVATSGGGIPPEVARQVAQQPGVRAATGQVATEVFLLDDALSNGSGPWAAAGLDPATLRGTLDLDVRAGNLDAVRGRNVAVSARLAKEGSVHVGDTLMARMADARPATLRVVAIYERALGMGDIVLPHGTARDHATAPLDAAIFVNGAVATLPSTVRTLTRADYLQGLDDSFQEDSRIQWVVAALMLLMAAMSVFTSGAMSAAERRSELVLARLAGATRRQVMRSQIIEAATTTAVGIAGGVVVVVASLVTVGRDEMGDSLVVPALPAALVLGLGAVLGLLGTLIPSAVMGRARLTSTSGLRQ